AHVSVVSCIRTSGRMRSRGVHPAQSSPGVQAAGRLGGGFADERVELREEDTATAGKFFPLPAEQCLRGWGRPPPRAAIDAVRRDVLDTPEDAEILGQAFDMERKHRICEMPVSFCFASPIRDRVARVRLRQRSLVVDTLWTPEAARRAETGGQRAA